MAEIIELLTPGPLFHVTPLNKIWKRFGTPYCIASLRADVRYVNLMEVTFTVQTFL